MQIQFSCKQCGHSSEAKKKKKITGTSSIKIKETNPDNALETSEYI